MATDAANAQIANSGGAEPPTTEPGSTGGGENGSGGEEPGTGGTSPPIEPSAPGAPTRYYGRFDLDPVRAIRQVEELLASVVNQLARADGADTKITIEINSTSAGFDDAVRRTVSENATQLQVRAQEFEA